MFGKPFDDYIKEVKKSFLTLYDDLVIKKKFERGTRKWCIKCAANIKKELKEKFK